MRITLCDSRTLAVAISRPVTDTWYNWTTNAFETPFASANHLKPLVPLEPAPSLFAGILTVDIGTILLERSDVAAVLCTVDSATPPNLIAPVDVWTLPSPVDSPGFGGFSR